MYTYVKFPAPTSNGNHSKVAVKKNLAVLPDAFPTQATIKLLSGLNVHTHLSAR